MAWLLASGLPNGLRDLRVLHRAVDAELRGAQAGGGLPDAVLVEEVLHEEQAAALGAEDGAVRDPDVVQRDAAVVGGHVEGPQVLLDLEAGGADRDQEPGDAGAAARGAAGAGEDQVVRGGVDAGVPGLLPGDDPVFAVARRGRLHEGGVAAVLGFGDAEREVAFARGEVVGPVPLVLRAAVVQHQQQADVVGHDRVLVLQVAVQAETLAGQVLADHRHAQVGAVPAAVLFRERVPEVAGRVGAPARLGQQRLPFAAGQAAAVPVGPGVFPAVVEEPFVVVLPLERLDLPLDELVEFGQVVAQVLGEGEVHGSPLVWDGQVGGVGDGELVHRGGADRLGDLAGAVVQRAVADLRAEVFVVGAAEGGEPGPVGLLAGRGQEGLALGDAQRVGRDPCVKLQDRVGGDPGTDLGGEEIADGVEQRRP